MAIISSNIFSIPSSLSFHSGTPNILSHLTLPYSSQMVVLSCFSISFFFSTLCCTLVWMISVDFEFTDPFVSMSSILLSDSKEFFVSDTIFLSVQEFLCKHYFSMLNFFIWANVLPMFSFKSFNTFIYLSLCLPVPTSGIH